MVDCKDPDHLVYTIQKEGDESGKYRVDHRNMLLSCEMMVPEDEFDDQGKISKNKYVSPTKDKKIKCERQEIGKSDFRDEDEEPIPDVPVLHCKLVTYSPTGVKTMFRYSVGRYIRTLR